MPNICFFKQEFETRCLPRTSSKYIETKMEQSFKKGMLYDEFAHQLEALAGELVKLSVIEQNNNENDKPIFAEQAQEKAICVFKREAKKKCQIYLRPKILQHYRKL